MILRSIKKVIKKFIIFPFRQLTAPKKKEFCNQQIPKIKYTDGSWLTIATTPDQQRIEDYLTLQQITVKQILHIGTGNSSFAKKFHATNFIDSITIVDDELDYAIALNLPNYRCFKLNKYSNDLLRLPVKYDIISDNNLSSFACCQQHFEEMMRNYFALLKPNGYIITDKKGMAYHQDFAFPITVDDLKIILPEAKFSIQEHTVIIEKKLD